MKRFLRVPVLLAISGCATTPATPAATTAAAPAAPTKMAITNVYPFDVAACGPRALSLNPLTTEVLIGAMLSLGPATQECFVDLTTRDGQPFDLKAKMTVNESGSTVEVNGLGASESGKACLVNTFKKLAVNPLPAGARPIVAEIPVGAGAFTVKFGENAANDIAGKMRLAQMGFCECYATIGDKAPPTLKIEIEAKDKKTTATVGSDPVAACLKPKIEAVDLGGAEAHLNWPLLLKNSYAREVDAAAPAALRFQQLDGMRQQRTADVLIASGQRVTAALAYDAAAQAYKKKPSKSALPELNSKCAAVAAGDDKQMAAVKEVVAVLEDSQKLVGEEKAKDPQWAQVETQLGKQLEALKAESARIEGQKVNDLKACPKTTY